MRNRSLIKTYPYEVTVIRDANWYPDSWRNYSTWCDDCVGSSEWQFSNDSFLFKTEEAQLAFILRWK